MVVGASGGGYVAPTVPVSGKVGFFLWGSDIASDGSSWPYRSNPMGMAAVTPVACTKETTTQGGFAALRMVPANGAYLRLDDALAALNVASNSVEEYVLWTETVTVGASCTLLAASSSVSTTPKRVLSYTTGVVRYTQQSTVAGPFVHNAKNTNLQMWRVRRRADGSVTIWRNEEPDPIAGFWGSGTAATAIAAQTGMDRYLVGAQWNGVSGPVNINDQRVVGLWYRLPGAAELTDAEGVELFCWPLGCYSAPPLYSDSITQFALFHCYGQSNSGNQGLSTAAFPSLPDASVKMFGLALNNDAYTPTAPIPLDRRQGASRYSSYIQNMPTGTFALPHHFTGVGKGATNAGSDWGGNNGAGPTSQLGGYVTTADLYSAVRMNAFMAKALFAGAPIPQIIWDQGENDAAAGAVVAGQYATNFGTGTINILLYLRAIINRLYGVSDAWCHGVQKSPIQTGGGIVLADLNIVRAGMVTVAGTVANMSLIETNDLTGIQGDNLHWDQVDGFQTQATRLVTSIKASNVLL